MFRSVADIYGGGVLACVLTGMGHDGASGAARIRAVGGRIVVQDEASSVVWGMPGSVVAAGLATDIVPLDRIAETLRNAVIPGARPSSGRVLPASAPRAVGPAMGVLASNRRVGGGGGA
jgi:two-component system chemotaxis response regulator CheB